jgi:ABC-type dipeptide/oligopeptide/nickel transport system permease component
MEQNFMRIYYFCDIFQQDYVLYARKKSFKDKDFLRGYIKRLGDRFQLI